MHSAAEPPCDAVLDRMPGIDVCLTVWRVGIAGRRLTGPEPVRRA
jgi:hypothetical protein